MNYHAMADELLKIAFTPTPDSIFGQVKSAVPPTNLAPHVASSRVAAVKGPTVPGGRMIKGLKRKLAGVGWDLHGYSEDPKDNPKSYRGKNDEDDVSWDAWERRQSMRIKTPHDQTTSLGYKMHDHIDYGAKNPGSLEKYKTDFAYGEKPTEVRLSKPKLREFLGAYQKALNTQEPDRQHPTFGPLKPKEREHAMALVQKGKHLLKQKNFRFARAEYE